MQKTIFCNQCGAQITVEETKEYVFCPDCGYKNILSGTYSGDVSAQNQPSEEQQPNLIISFETNNAAVTLATRIVELGLKSYYIGGSVSSFLLEPGQYTVVIQFNRRKYIRNIIIPENQYGYTVTINCMFNGHTHIYVDQPGYTEDTTVRRQMNPPRLPVSVMSIIALLCSISVFGAPVGVFLSFLDRKKHPKNSRAVAKIAMIFGFIVLGCALIYIYFSWLIPAVIHH